MWRLTPDSKDMFIGTCFFTDTDTADKMAALNGFKYGLTYGFKLIETFSFFGNTTPTNTHTLLSFLSFSLLTTEHSYNTSLPVDTLLCIRVISCQVYSNLFASSFCFVFCVWSPHWACDVPTSFMSNYLLLQVSLFISLLGFLYLPLTVWISYPVLVSCIWQVKHYS